MNDAGTIRSRILDHLKKNIRLIGDYNASECLTQKGIAEALGVTRAHASVEILKLTRRGMACEYLRHVKGHKMRMKVYGPTFQSNTDNVMRIKPRDYENIKNHLRAALEILVLRQERR